MSMYGQAHPKRACMWTRELVYVIAPVGTKNDWVSVCLSVYSSLNPVLHWHIFKHICLKVAVCGSV